MPANTAGSLAGIAMGLASWWGLSVVAETPPVVATGLEPYLQYGALGILGVTVYSLLKLLAGQYKSQQAAMKELCDRQHTDSMKLDETLRNLSTTCTQTQATIKQQQERRP